MDTGHLTTSPCSRTTVASRSSANAPRRSWPSISRRSWPSAAAYRGEVSSWEGEASAQPRGRLGGSLALPERRLGSAGASPSRSRPSRPVAAAGSRRRSGRMGRGDGDRMGGRRRLLQRVPVRCRSLLSPAIRSARSRWLSEPAPAGDLHASRNKNEPA